MSNGHLLIILDLLLIALLKRVKASDPGLYADGGSGVALPKEFPVQ